MLDFKYDKEVNDIFGSAHKCRALNMTDFIDKNLQISIFEEKKGVAGVFEQFEKENSKNENNFDLSEDQITFIDSILELSLKKYNPDTIPINKLFMFHQIVNMSTEKFNCTINPEKNTVIACHYMAKTYGGEPWDYLNSSIDRFLFNLYCYNIGTREEINIAKREASKNKKRR